MKEMIKELLKEMILEAKEGSVEFTNDELKALNDLLKKHQKNDISSFIDDNSIYSFVVTEAMDIEVYLRVLKKKDNEFNIQWETWTDGESKPSVEVISKAKDIRSVIKIADKAINEEVKRQNR